MVKLLQCECDNTHEANHTVCRYCYERDLMPTDQLQNKYGYWSEHPSIPLEDWIYAVDNGDTRAGYWDWIASKLEEEEPKC